jgi:uncharacterized membrane protein YeaQ/YmgE (transglycosylase-associated protein family)
MAILIILLIGAVAGWLGSEIFRGAGFGLIGNMVLGILGSFVGSWLLNLLHWSFGAGILGAIITGAIGAIVILVLANLIFPRKKMA